MLANKVKRVKMESKARQAHQAREVLAALLLIRMQCFEEGPVRVVRGGIFNNHNIREGVPVLLAVEPGRVHVYLLLQPFNLLQRSLHPRRVDLVAAGHRFFSALREQLLDLGR